MVKINQKNLRDGSLNSKDLEDITNASRKLSSSNSGRGIGYYAAISASYLIERGRATTSFVAGITTAIGVPLASHKLLYHYLGRGEGPLTWFKAFESSPFGGMYQYDLIYVGLLLVSAPVSVLFLGPFVGNHLNDMLENCNNKIEIYLGRNYNPNR